MRLRLLSISAIALLLPLTSFAQSIGSVTDALGGTPFSVSISPDYPTAYSQATLSFLSSSLDLANATMEVLVGTKEIYRGAVHPITVPTGKEGSVTNVKIILSSGGISYTQSVVIQPQDVVLVAEPISSVPPLYPGKPLVPLDGSVRVVAVANFKDAAGKILSPSTLSYSWSVDDTQLATASGIGKTSLMVASPYQYRERTVSVVVRGQSGNLVGGANLSLTAEKSSLRIYQNDPLLGIRFDRALRDTFSLGSTETTFYAAPFSIQISTGVPLVRWFLNGDAAQTGNSITLRPAGDGQGDASLSATSGSATEDLQVSFGAKSTNFFGL